jgi:hypothetical protein
MVKISKKEAFLETINRSFSDYLYDLNLLGQKNWCFFCLKKSTKRAEKERKSEDFLFQKTFQLNTSDLVDILKEKKPKREYFRGKQIK